MNVNDRVQLTDAGGTHVGSVTAMSDNGMCWVKWDAGLTERVHESELVPEGAPATGHQGALAALVPPEDRPAFRERIAASIKRNTEILKRLAK